VSFLTAHQHIIIFAVFDLSPLTIWINCVFTTCSELQKVLFLAPSVCSFLLCMNGFAPNSHGKRARSLARPSLKVKFKGQGHQGETKNGILALSAACVQFMFGKTSLASSLTYACNDVAITNVSIHRVK